MSRDIHSIICHSKISKIITTWVAHNNLASSNHLRKYIDTISLTTTTSPKLINSIHNLWHHSSNRLTNHHKWWGTVPRPCTTVTKLNMWVSSTRWLPRHLEIQIQCPSQTFPDQWPLSKWNLVTRLRNITSLSTILWHSVIPVWQCFTKQITRPFPIRKCSACRAGWVRT